MAGTRSIPACRRLALAVVQSDLVRRRRRRADHDQARPSAGRDHLIQAAAGGPRRSIRLVSSASTIATFRAASCARIIPAAPDAWLLAL